MPGVVSAEIWRDGSYHTIPPGQKSLTVFLVEGVPKMGAMFDRNKWTEAVETAMRRNIAPGVVGDSLKDAMRREWCGGTLADGVEWAISAAGVGIECLTPGDSLATDDDIREYLEWHDSLEVDELRNCFDADDYTDDPGGLDYSTAILMTADDTRVIAYFLFDSVIPKMGMWAAFVEFCDLNEIIIPEYLYPRVA